MKKEPLTDEEESIRACYVEFKEAKESMRATPFDVTYTKVPKTALQSFCGCLPCGVEADDDLLQVASRELYEA